MVFGEVRPETLLKWIEEQGCVGKVDRKWAWWRDPDGSMGLSPVHGTRYLYRGQNRRYWSCRPSISRSIRTRARSLGDLDVDEQLKVLDALIRSDWYCEIIQRHPVFEWAKNKSYSIDRMALAQHYELPTGYIDLTESIEVALFFACCQFRNGKWEAKARGRGILYRLDWVEWHDQIGSRIKAIGLQPFPRPYAQWAWTVEMMLGEDFEDIPGVEAVTFEHSAEIGEGLLYMFDGGNELLPSDPIYDWACEVKKSRQLPRSNGLSVVHDISQDPFGIQTNDADETLRQIEDANGISFTDAPEFSIDEESIARLSADWEASKATFMETMTTNTRVQLLRRRRDADSERGEA